MIHERLTFAQKKLWFTLRGETQSPRGYLGTREAALRGDPACRKTMLKFAMLYLKSRLTS